VTAVRPRIPLSSPDLSEDDVTAVAAVLRTPWLSLGPKVVEFEDAIASYVAAPHAVAVSSGTAGLHLCVRALGIGDGDEVIVPSFTFVAAANAIRYERATPVFVDVERETLNLDPARVAAAITPRTRAILVVHTFGCPADMEPLLSFARERRLLVIEDACEALGAEYRGRALGSYPHPAVFAFYPNKQVTTGEGGAVAVHGEDQWRLLKSLSNQGRTDSGGWLEHARYGYNYRLDDLSAAVGLAQVERLDEILALRSRAAGCYRELLAPVEGVEPLCDDDLEHRRSWFVYPVRLAEGRDRERVIAHLAERGIGTARYLPSIHLQPYMRERFGYREGMLPVSEEASRRLLAIPFFTEISPEQQERVVAALREGLAAAGS
jgi:dTDP-4-amino-4,6-dideoxygalactose transaminase